MTVLVLGSDGFLGRHVVQAALSHGADVVTLVQHEEIASGGSSESRLIRRVFDPIASGPEGVRELLDEFRPRALINAAGATRGDLVQLVAANVALVAALVQGIASTRLDRQRGSVGPREGGCRLVHVGSAAEYAAKVVGASTGTGDLADPVSAYGVTKLAGTKLVAIAAERGEIDGSVIRVFNPIGPHSPSVGLAGGAAASVARAIAAGQKTLDLGDLSAFRDFIDVRDAADLIVKAALKEGTPPPPILNAGTGRASMARDLVRSLVTISGWDGTVRENGQGSPASVGVDWQQADISSSTAEFSWRPYRSMEDSLTDLWRSRG